MEHDWQPIAPPEDNGIMCTVCLECKCCSDWTDKCAGEWTPDPAQGSFQDLGGGFYRVSGTKRSAITNRYIGEQ